jgi:hypothetical protein
MFNLELFVFDMIAKAARKVVGKFQVFVHKSEERKKASKRSERRLIARNCGTGKRAFSGEVTGHHQVPVWLIVVDKKYPNMNLIFLQYHNKK